MSEEASPAGQATTSEDDLENDLVHPQVVAHRGVDAVGVHRVDADAELAKFDRQ